VRSSPPKKRRPNASSTRRTRLRFDAAALPTWNATSRETVRELPFEAEGCRMAANDDLNVHAGDTITVRVS
jgi:hypothetical protein